MESVVAWECEEGCPALALDRRSGMVGGGGDQGASARFFPQFTDEEELCGWLRRLIGI